MFWGILHRSIFWELIKVFGLALIGLTGMILLAGVVAEASQRGLGPAQVLAAIPLIVPSTMPYTIPTTTLFATCLVYGRLAADNEILAIKAAGISIYRVVWPAVLLGLMTAIVTMGLYAYVIPISQYTLRVQFLKDVEEFLYGMLKQDRCINHPRLNYAIWVRQVQGRRLVDATFKRRDPKGNYDLIVRAREAELRVDARNEKVIVHMRHGEVFSVNTATRAYFEDRFWELQLPGGSIGEEKFLKAREMTWPQLFEKEVELQQLLDNLGAQLAAHAAQVMLTQPPDTLVKAHENLKLEHKWRYRELLSVIVEAHMRPMLAAGCLCFVLVGCPVGIWFSKSDYLSAFVTCFLPIVLIYYPLMLCGLNVARAGRFPVALCLWPANLLLALTALWLLRRLARY